MEENKNTLKIGDMIFGVNCLHDEVRGAIIKFEDSPEKLPIIFTKQYGDTLVWKAAPLNVTVVSHSITSDTAEAKEHLKETGEAMTPEAVRDALWSGACGHITGATLGRKFRAAANRGELIKSYYVNERGTKIAQYSWNKEQSI